MGSYVNTPYNGHNSMVPRERRRSQAKNIYFARHLDTRALKIGRSRDAKQRVERLEQLFGGRIALMGVSEGAAVEQQLHHYLERWSIGSEWFRGEPPVIEVAKRSIHEGIASGLDLAEWLYRRNCA